MLEHGALLVEAVPVHKVLAATGLDEQFGIVARTAEMALCVGGLGRRSVLGRVEDLSNEWCTNGEYDGR